MKFQPIDVDIGPNKENKNGTLIQAHEVQALCSTVLQRSIRTVVDSEHDVIRIRVYVDVCKNNEEFKGRIVTYVNHG